MSLNHDMEEIDTDRKVITVKPVSIRVIYPLLKDPLAKNIGHRDPRFNEIIVPGKRNLCPILDWIRPYFDQRFLNQWCRFVGDIDQDRQMVRRPIKRVSNLGGYGSIVSVVDRKIEMCSIITTDRIRIDIQEEISTVQQAFRTEHHIESIIQTTSCATIGQLLSSS
jgi:hypothetical protein